MYTICEFARDFNALQMRWRPLRFMHLPSHHISCIYMISEAVCLCIQAYTVTEYLRHHLETDTGYTD